MVELIAEPTGTRVEIATDLTLSGSVAQFARGAGMIDDIASHLIGQFADNLRDKLAATEKTEETTAEPAPPLRAGALGIALLWRALLRLAGRFLGGTG